MDHGYFSLSLSFLFSCEFRSYHTYCLMFVPECQSKKLLWSCSVSISSSAQASVEESIDRFCLWSLLLVEHELLVGPWLGRLVHLFPLVEHEHVLPLVRVEIDLLSKEINVASITLEQDDRGPVIGFGRLLELHGLGAYLLGCHSSITTVDFLTINFQLVLVHTSGRSLRVIPQFESAKSHWLLKQD